MDNKEFSTLKEKAYKACQEFIGGTWETTTLEDFQFDVVEGGLSNKLYCCTLPENCGNNVGINGTPKKVLMRIYGQLQSGQDNRLQEITIFTLLSERNLGPKLYGLFSDGRLEEFIPSQSIKRDGLFVHALSIAVELAKIHALELPVKKRTLFPGQAYEWLEFAEKNIEEENLTPYHRTLLGGEFRKEIEWVMNETRKMGPPIVFCHNDVQGGNVLLMDSPRSDGRNLMFIDFEFGAYNYRSFDIAELFNIRGFDFGTVDSLFFYHVHLEKYPTESEQIEFIDVYLSQLQKDGVLFKNDFQTERSKILKEIPLLRLAVLIHWIIGVVKMNCLSSYNLQFLKLSEDIWKIYKTLKEQFVEHSYQRNKEH